MILWVFASATHRALNQLDCLRGRLEVPQPEVLRVLPAKLRFQQSWGFFSPDAAVIDETMVVDALTVDGRHVDPFTGRAPSRGIGVLGITQIWSDYYRRIHDADHVRERLPLQDFLLRYPERTGRPEDALVSCDVYWVRAKIPVAPHGADRLQEVAHLLVQGPRRGCAAGAVRGCSRPAAPPIQERSPTIHARARSTRDARASGMGTGLLTEKYTCAGRHHPCSRPRTEARARWVEEAGR